MALFVFSPSLSVRLMLPHIPLHTKNEYILDKPRWKWCVSAAKALVGATDAHLRWLLVRAGQDEFIRLGRLHFKRHEPAIDFTDDELRWMFQVLEASIPARFREAQIAKEIERFQRKVLTDKQLKNGAGEGPTGHDGPTLEMGNGITVETLPDRDKTTVH